MAYAINEEIPDAVTRWSLFLAYVSNETRSVDGSDDLFTASLNLGFS